MPNESLRPLRTLRRGEEEEALAHLTRARAGRERAEAEEEVQLRRVATTQARLVDASARAAGFQPNASNPPTVITGAELERQAAFIERLRVEAGRAQRSLASFRAHELATAHAVEHEAREAYRRHRGDREGLDKHLAALNEAARQRLARRDQEP